jgi:hypothetical protein
MHKMQILHHFVQILHTFRRNDRRDARLMPPIRHFVSAVGSLISTEMTQMQRIARLMPPLHNCHCRFSGYEGRSR